MLSHIPIAEIDLYGIWNTLRITNNFVELKLKNLHHINCTFRAKCRIMVLNILLKLFQAKKEIYSIKEQRLMLAQDEFQHLNDTLSGWKSSRTSCKCVLRDLE